MRSLPSPVRRLSAAAGACGQSRSSASRRSWASSASTSPASRRTSPRRWRSAGDWRAPTGQRLRDRGRSGGGRLRLRRARARRDRLVHVGRQPAIAAGDGAAWHEPRPRRRFRPSVDRRRPPAPARALPARAVLALGAPDRRPDSSSAGQALAGSALRRRGPPRWSPREDRRRAPARSRSSPSPGSRSPPPSGRTVPARWPPRSPRYGAPPRA